MDNERAAYTLIVVTVIVAAIFFVLLMLPVRAEPSTGVAYCALYAREAVRIDIMHTKPMRAISKEYVEDMAVTVFKQCVSILPTLLPLPEEHRNLTSWLEDMQVFTASKMGTEPAGDADDEEWRQQCRAQYFTWEEETGTVIRKGSPDRVRCPCGSEIDCNKENIP